MSLVSQVCSRVASLVTPHSTETHSSDHRAHIWAAGPARGQSLTSEQPPLRLTLTSSCGRGCVQGRVLTRSVMRTCDVCGGLDTTEHPVSAPARHQVH